MEAEAKNLVRGLTATLFFIAVFVMGFIAFVIAVAPSARRMQSRFLPHCSTDWPTLTGSPTPRCYLRTCGPAGHWPTDRSPSRARWSSRSSPSRPPVVWRELPLERQMQVAQSAGSARRRGLALNRLEVLSNTAITAAHRAKIAFEQADERPSLEQNQHRRYIVLQTGRRDFCLIEQAPRRLVVAGHHCGNGCHGQ